MWGMTSVISGADMNKHLYAWYGIYVVGPESPYFVGEDWLPFNIKNDAQCSTGQGDWNGLYWDGTSNQAYHFWFYVAVAYYDGLSWANLANYVHDDYWNGESEGNITKEDYDLSIKGMQLGSLLRALQDASVYSTDIDNINDSIVVF